MLNAKGLLAEVYQKLSLVVCPSSLNPVAAANGAKLRFTLIRHLWRTTHDEQRTT
jgi:hypothetical protein